MVGTKVLAFGPPHCRSGISFIFVKTFKIMKKKYFFVIFFGMVFFPMAQAQMAGVQIPEPLAVCSPGACTQLQAVYTGGKYTSDYAVTPIPYQPLYPFTGGTVINASCDDVWSPEFTLPFNFCFYGDMYNKLLVGSNGLITFDNSIPNNIGCNGLKYCDWYYTQTIPNPAFPVRNAIYGVYQDTDIRTVTNGGAITDAVIQNVNYYIGGTAPNRYFVVNFNQLPLFYCGASAGLQTSQVILYETTNVIDVIVKNRMPCTSWQQPNGVIGIQNQDGTLATFPPGRNTGAWTATNEAYRFTPNGATPANAIAWFKNGVAYSSGNAVIDVCPEEGDIFTASVTYPGCGSNEAVLVSASRTMHITPVAAGNPVDLSVCTADALAAFDLTANIPVVLGANDPNNYDISFHASQSDAENYATPLGNTNNFMAADNQAIYMRIEDYTIGCYAIRSFQLHLNTPPGQPVGATEQFFTAGQTLADLEVAGTNLTWYDQPLGGNMLSATTPLVDGTTYYVSQTNASGCENTDRSALATDRLPVTAYLAMGTSQWNRPVFEIKPNPVKDVLTISATQKIDSVSVYSLQGQRILEIPVNANTTRVDLSKLATGTYLVKINADAYVKTVKIIRG